MIFYSWVGRYMMIYAPHHTVTSLYIYTFSPSPMTVLKCVRYKY